MINNATMRWWIHPDENHTTGWSQDEDLPCEFLTCDEAKELIRQMVIFVAPFLALYDSLEYNECVRFLESGGVRKGWEHLCIQAQRDAVDGCNSLVEVSLVKDGAEYNYSFTILEAISHGAMGS